MALSVGSQDVNSSTEPSSKAVDVVAILDAKTLAQAVELMRPLAAVVYEVASVMEHPLEDGATIADHIVFEPIEIEMPAVMVGDYAEVYGELRQLFHNGTLLTIQTRTDTYASMLIVEMPHDETADAIDAATLNIKFREAKFVKATYGGAAPPLSQAQVKDKPKASTTNRGTQQTTTASAPKTEKAAEQYRGSHLHRWFGDKD